MDRSTLRRVAVALGFCVSPRSSHSAAIAYDWAPKHPMLSNHFKTEEEAWRSLEDRINSLIRITGRISAALLEDAQVNPPVVPSGLVTVGQLIEKLSVLDDSMPVLVPSCCSCTTMEPIESVDVCVHYDVHTPYDRVEIT